LKRPSKEEEESLTHRPVYVPISWLEGPHACIDSKVTVQESAGLLILTRELQNWPAFISRLLVSTFMIAIALGVVSGIGLPLAGHYIGQLAGPIFLSLGLLCVWLVLRELLNDLYAVETLRIDQTSIVMEITSPLKSRGTVLEKSDLRPVLGITPPVTEKGRFHALRIRANSKSHSCFQGIGAVNAFRLQGLVNQHVGRLAGFRECHTDTQTGQGRTGKKCLSEKYIHWIGPEPSATKPDDSGWHLERGFTGSSFSLAGRFNSWCFVEQMIAVAVCAFFTKAFLIDHFQLHLAGTWSNADLIERAAMLLIVSSTAAHNLKFLWNLTAVSFANAYRETWEFSRDKVELRYGWFGINRSKTWDIRSLKGIAITRTARYNPTGLTPRSRYTFDLNFVGQDGLAICQILDLKFDEANWIGQQVMHQQPEWFETPPGK
jgi:hypothetical protein